MDREEHWDLDLPDFELPGDGDGDGGGVEPPREPPRSGGGGPRIPPPEPFLHSRWGPAVTAAIVLLFGLQSVFVVWLSRTGLGTEAMAWGIATVFIVSFTGVFIWGARYIGRHRY